MYDIRLPELGAVIPVPHSFPRASQITPMAVHDYTDFLKGLRVRADNHHLLRAFLKGCMLVSVRQIISGSLPIRPEDGEK
jgi:hypothetical protein